jgi:site-specific DNA recombinase
MLRSDRVLDSLPPALSGRVRAELASREGGHRGGAKSLLAGLATCGECGGPLKLFGRRQNGSGDKVWAAYGCRARGHVYISQPWLDEHVRSAVLGAIDKGKLARKVGRATKTNAGAADIEARIDTLERDYYERGILGRESYLRRREALLARLEAARTAPPTTPGLPRELALHLDERWPDLTVGERRRIIGAVLDNVAVDKGRARNRTIDPTRVRLSFRGN